MPAVAVANNDVAIVSWKLKEKIDNCLGFAVYRIDSTGKQQALPAWVGFQGEDNAGWKAQTTETWPVQKFSWRDLTAKRGEEYTYKIVPMVGKPGELKALLKLAVKSNPVTLSPVRGSFSAYFNRGILSTQSLVHKIPPGPNGAPNYLRLKDRIDQPGDPLRNSLSGELRLAMLDLFARAKHYGGELWAALYELTDPELEQQLLLNANILHLILSNTGTDDSENTPARQALHEAKADVTDRMVGSGHIGHNKFVVLTDKHGKARAVWTGSTNWTDTGLCAQCNNGIMVESPELAAIYLDYWHRLKADDAAQGPLFRAANNHPHNATTPDGSQVTLWFSPNTKQKSKPAGDNAPKPSDMGDVFAAMERAHDSILFLVFQPGSPSIVDQAASAQSTNPELFVRGAATDPGVVGDFNTHLFNGAISTADADVVAAAAIDDQFGFWERELLKSGPKAHAIIHDKIIVIDPFSPNCVVITGSHNLGYRASYNNDENLLIVRGNRPLAEAYATHVMDVYDHFRWRYWLQQKGHQAWNGLQRDARWQDKYFMESTVSRREQDFWMKALDS